MSGSAYATLTYFEFHVVSLVLARACNRCRPLAERRQSCSRRYYVSTFRGFGVGAQFAILPAWERACRAPRSLGVLSKLPLLFAMRSISPSSNSISVFLLVVDESLDGYFDGSHQVHQGRPFLGGGALSSRAGR
jgi:hypothetical protein